MTPSSTAVPVSNPAASEAKHRIVDVLQTDGHIVAMTGGSVNDVKALRLPPLAIGVDDALDLERVVSATIAAGVVPLKPIHPGNVALRAGRSKTP